MSAVVYIKKTHITFGFQCGELQNSIVIPVTATKLTPWSRVLL